MIKSDIHIPLAHRNYIQKQQQQTKFAEQKIKDNKIVNQNYLKTNILEKIRTKKQLETQIQQNKWKQNDNQENTKKFNIIKQGGRVNYGQRNFSAFLHKVVKHKIINNKIDLSKYSELFSNKNKLTIQDLNKMIQQYPELYQLILDLFSNKQQYNKIVSKYPTQYKHSYLFIREHLLKQFEQKYIKQFFPRIFSKELKLNQIKKLWN